MIIDIFKDKQLWEDLDKHTETLTNLVNDYDFEKEDTSPWFNPIRFREYPLTTDIGGALNTNPLPQNCYFIVPTIQQYVLLTSFLIRIF